MEHLSDGSSGAVEDVFELVGILVHSGTAESGHYYSYIKERPRSAARESWIEFNDDVVSPWDPSLMASSTFGGPDARSAYETNGVLYDKSYSAYMLFYQRVSSLQSEQKWMASQHLSAPLRVDLPTLLKEHIVSENTLILRRHCLFDPGHALFVQNCFGRTRYVDGVGADSPGAAKEGGEASDQAGSGHALQDLAMTMAVSHLDQVMARTRDTPCFGYFSAMVMAAVVNCPGCALALYEHFDERHGSYRALIQRSPEQHVRAFAGEVLVRAAEKIAESLPHVYGLKGGARGGAGHSVMEGVAMLFNHLWQYFQIHLRSWDEYFGTMLSFAKLGHAEAGLMLSQDYLVKLLRIVAADASMDLPPNYARMLNNVLRRINTRPPSYSAILALMGHLLAQLSPVLNHETIVEQPTERLGLRPPFPWTSDEVQVVHHHPERQVASFLVEKLVAINQAWGVTSDIVARLTSTGPQMEARIGNTLRKNMQGELSTQPMDPFLRAAGRYVECARSAENAHAVIRHVCAQARSLQITEGAAFLDFVQVALRAGGPDEEAARRKRESSMDMVPTWAPYLLVYPDGNTRRRAEQLLDDEVLQGGQTRARGAEDEDEDQARAARVAREVGSKCLVFLREAYVKRQAKIERDAAWSILRVVGRCAPFHEGGVDEDGNEDDGYAALQSGESGRVREGGAQASMGRAQANDDGRGVGPAAKTDGGRGGRRGIG